MFSERDYANENVTLCQYLYKGKYYTVLGRGQEIDTVCDKALFLSFYQGFYRLLLGRFLIWFIIFAGHHTRKKECINDKHKNTIEKYV